MPHLPRTLFETPRLIGRHLCMDDVDALYAVYGDPKAMRWVGDGEPLARQHCIDWVEVTEGNYATRGYGMTALVLRESGEVVGFCGLVHPGGQPECEIKYTLRRPFWGRGLATEAASAMLAYGARTHGLSRVIATIYPENTASARVLAKVGMQEVETRTGDDGTRIKVFAWQPPNAAPSP
jgi:RimJ/RimL family protein N-acetyltransferase